ncbi:MAG: hypothetical protein MI867_12495 [Pseudomonadales bacterium]|nr:hypothetical protein [Pseudomonadales bacterium]
MKTSMEEINGIFPIAELEAEVLHSLGWASGYGWENNFDWWLDGDGWESAKLEETKFKLIRHIMIIRQFRDESMLAAKKYIRNEE